MSEVREAIARLYFEAKFSRAWTESANFAWRREEAFEKADALIADCPSLLGRDGARDEQRLPDAVRKGLQFLVGWGYADERPFLGDREAIRAFLAASPPTDTPEGERAAKTCVTRACRVAGDHVSFCPYFGDAKPHRGSAPEEGGAR